MEAKVIESWLAFRPECLEKVKQIRAKYPNLNIQVDGGIKLDNIDQVAKSGANVIVSGTGIFGQKDPANIIQSMKLSIDSTI